MKHTATKIISPEITDPKIKIHTVISHPAVVTTPVLLGTKKEIHELERVNAVTGEVVATDKIEINRPYLGEIR